MIIKPFKGIRPPKELVEQVESRPYDVLDSEEARAEAGDNEKSLYHIIKPEIDFPVGTSEYDPRVYEKAAENFQKFQDKGWLVQDKEEHYYIYAQTMNGTQAHRRNIHQGVVGTECPKHLSQALPLQRIAECLLPKYRGGREEYAGLCGVEELQDPVESPSGRESESEAEFLGQREFRHLQL